MSLRLLPIYAVTLLVAFCSILYELLIAQTLSATMGGTVVRYNVSIGFYLASLGIGAFYFTRKTIKDLVPYFLKIEVILAASGFASVFAVIGVDYICRVVGLPLLVSGVFNHLLIVLIGFLSGIELPVLIGIGRQIQDRSGTKVLAWDYVGTLIGAVVFPLVLLPKFGIFETLAGVAVVNIISAIALSLYLGERSEKKAGMYVMLLFASLILALVVQNLGEFFVRNIYLAGLTK